MLWCNMGKIPPFLLENTVTCLCSLDRKTKVDSCVALRCCPLLIKVRWPFLEQAHAWLLPSLPISTRDTPALMMQGCNWTPSYSPIGAVRHSPVWWLLRASLSGNQSHACEGEDGLHSPSETLFPVAPSCTCKHLPRSLFRICKPDSSVKGRY